MTSFVLVHGGWHGGWCWRPVARRLRDQGHEVFTPTLTGLGERSHLLSAAINLDTHIMDVANVIDFEDLHDVVLVGHSYGGMVITGVADRMPGRIASLVYLDAIVPEDGDSVISRTSDEFRQLLIEGASRDGGLYAPPVPSAAFNVNERDRAWVDEKCGPHPLASCLQRILLTGAWKAVPRKAFIYATDWSGSPFPAQYESLRVNAAWVTRTAHCGHDVMIDMPDEVAGWLVEL
jgi:pimeloyl-ACP methyl ester carboxylesterase